MAGLAKESLDRSLAPKSMGFGGPDVKEGLASLKERHAPKF